MKTTCLFVFLLSFICLAFAVNRNNTCSDPVQCFVDPCFQNNCKAGCISNYCGGCSYNCACSADSDCQSSEFCDIDSMCSPFIIIVGEGESCGGFRLPPVPQCSDSLICVNTQRFIADIPGVCRGQCSTNQDCPQEQFCSEEGVCLADAQCLTDSDCSNSGNLFATPDIFCETSQTTFCNKGEGRCDTVCGDITCYSFFDCPSTMDCDLQTNICKTKNKCDIEGCPQPAPGAPNVLCNDGSIGGPICRENQNGECQWQIRQCPTTCSCGPPPIVNALCLNGQPPVLICEQISENSQTNAGATCAWSVQCSNSSSCDCSSFPIPEIAKECEDGSFVGATCVATPSGCSYEFLCPSTSSNCSADNVQCAHPIGGDCLGICDQNRCVLSAYDYCLLSPATVFTITLNKLVSDQELISDLSSFSKLSTHKIFILGSTNRQFNVEFVDDKKVSAATAISTLQSNIENGKVDGSSLEKAKVVVLSTEVNNNNNNNQSSSADDGNNDQSSSANLLIANLFALLFFALI